MADSVEPSKCGADPCCHGNDIWARRGDLVAYRLVNYMTTFIFDVSDDEDVIDAGAGAVITQT